MPSLGACEVCGGALRLIHDFGRLPLCNDLRTEAPEYPLVLAICETCRLIQLSEASRVPPETVFPRSYPYRSWDSPQLHAAAHEHCEFAATLLRGRSKSSLRVLDVGANDGTFMVPFWEQGVEILGIDPTDAVEDCQRDLRLWRVPFDDAAVERVLSEFGRCDLVTCYNVFAHVPDPVAFADRFRRVLKADGFLIVSNHDAAAVIHGLQWDTVYHEHRRYYTGNTLRGTLGRAGLETQLIRHTSMHGGSVEVVARHADRQVNGQVRLSDHDLVVDAVTTFGERVAASRRALRQAVEEAAVLPGGVRLVGVPSRAGTLVSYAGLAPRLSGAFEREGSSKIGGWLPGTNVPITVEPEGPIEGAALLGAHHLGRDFTARVAGKFRGPVIVPIPRVVRLHAEEHAGHA